MGEQIHSREKFHFALQLYVYRITLYDHTHIHVYSTLCVHYTKCTSLSAYTCTVLYMYQCVFLPHFTDQLVSVLSPHVRVCSDYDLAGLEGREVGLGGGYSKATPSALRQKGLTDI